MSIARWLTQRADVYVRAVSYNTSGLEMLATESLRSSGLACLAVPESNRTYRVFFLQSANVWRQGDAEMRIMLSGGLQGAATTDLMIRPGTGDPLLGLMYGQVDYGSSLHGTHLELLAEVKEP